jgi:hypothetical protein
VTPEDRAEMASRFRIAELRHDRDVEIMHVIVDLIRDGSRRVRVHPVIERLDLDDVALALLTALEILAQFRDHAPDFLDGYLEEIRGHLPPRVDEIGGA